MTKLDYWNMPAVPTSEAKVMKVFTAADGRDVVVLDQTIFYAQGGGQPADRGTIIRSEVREQRSEVTTQCRMQNAEFTIEDVRHVDGEVYHYGRCVGEKLAMGDIVCLEIDWERRWLNTRLHSAAHLLDAVMKQNYPECKPIKSYHFPEGPYVEYQSAQVLGLERMKALLNSCCQFYQTEKTPTTVDMSNPTHRVVTLHLPQPHQIPCGGTHVNNVSEIGQLEIRKIKLKNGICRISYALI